MSLTVEQKISVEIEMQRLERVLCQIRERLQRRRGDGILLCHVSMTPQTQAHVEALMERMLVEIRAIAQEFDLAPSLEDVGAYIMAEMAGAWSDLHDTLSPKLRRYGPVDPSLRETLDPHIRVLIELAQEMGQAANSAPPELVGS